MDWARSSRATQCLVGCLNPHSGFRRFVHQICSQINQGLFNQRFILSRLITKPQTCLFFSHVLMMLPLSFPQSIPVIAKSYQSLYLICPVNHKYGHSHLLLLLWQVKDCKWRQQIDFKGLKD